MVTPFPLCCCGDGTIVINYLPRGILALSESCGEAKERVNMIPIRGSDQEQPEKTCTVVGPAPCRNNEVLCGTCVQPPERTYPRATVKQVSA